MAAGPRGEGVAVARWHGEDVVVVGRVFLVGDVWCRGAADLLAPRTGPRARAAGRTACPAKETFVEPRLRRR